MVRITVLLAIALFLAGRVSAADRAVGRVESCDFATRSLPPPFRVPKQFAEGYRLFQAAGPYVPESLTVKSIVLLDPVQVGLTAQESSGLHKDLDNIYGRISADALFENIKSALPYCLADTRQSHGHYFVYFPKKIRDDTRVIVFLHGFGGNLLFNTYLLKEAFPDSIILLPSWGVSWQSGTMQYLEDMYKDVKQRTKFSIRKPCLMGISAGGPAGFRLYSEQPDRFACYVSIASAPSRANVSALKKGLKILMVNGRHDSRFPIARVEPLAAEATRRAPGLQFHVVDGDHFFMLSKREEDVSSH